MNALPANIPLPVFLTMNVRSELDSSGTEPKSLVNGVTVMIAPEPAAAPVTVAVVPAAPVKITVPLKLPVCVGLNRTITVWL